MNAYVRCGAKLYHPGNGLVVTAPRAQLSAGQRYGAGEWSIHPRHGKPQQITQSRARREALAVTAEDVKGWSREEGREKIKGVQLMYVYHNVVDARGDAANTESETFAAVEDAIDELDQLTRKILMHLNTSTCLLYTSPSPRD